MTYNLYSVRDVKTSFAAPFMDINDASAERGFLYAFSNNSGIMQYAPSDFSLYRIGYFDSDTGHLTDILPVFICDATKWCQKGDPNPYDTYDVAPKEVFLNE